MRLFGFYNKLYLLIYVLVGIRKYIIILYVCKLSNVYFIGNIFSEMV